MDLLIWPCCFGPALHRQVVGLASKHAPTPDGVDLGVADVQDPTSNSGCELKEQKFDKPSKPLEEQEFDNPTRLRVYAVGLVALSAVAFSLMSVCLSANSYDSDLASYAAMGFFRFCFPWLVCAGALLVCRQNPRSGFLQYNTLVRTALNVVAALLEIATLSQLQLVDATIIMFMHPFFAALLGVRFLGEEWSHRRSALLLLAFTGVVVACAPWEHTHRDRSPLEQPFGIACGVCFALIVATMNVWTRARTSKVGALLLIHHYLFIGTLISAVICLCMAGVQTPRVLHLVATQNAIPIFIVTLCIVVGELACTKGFQLADVGVLSAVRNIDIALVFLWQVVILRQMFSLWSAVGAACVGISTYMFVLPWIVDGCKILNWARHPRLLSHCLSRVKHAPPREQEDAACAKNTFCSVLPHESSDVAALCSEAARHA